MSHTVRNPASHDLWCDPLQRSFAAKEVVEIDDADEALAALMDSPIFMVDDQGEGLDIKADDLDRDVSAERSGEKSTAERADSQRGAVQVEQSAPPVTEKR